MTAAGGGRSPGGAALVVAVVAGAALAGAAWDEIAGLLLVGWIVVRIFAALFANEAFAWLRRRSGRD